MAVIFIAGDSTAAANPAHSPYAGWGQMLSEFVGLDVKNQAASGRSSKSFIDEGRLDEIAVTIRQGDYLLIQFGHNDEKSEDQSRFTDPYGTYKDCLSQYIAVAWKTGAKPVLLSPVSRRYFENGRIVNSHGVYPEAMKQLAEQEKVSFIDTCEQTRILYEQMGEEESKSLFAWYLLVPRPDGPPDHTHYSHKGAKAIAAIVAQELRNIFEGVVS
jgi:lysophospholipase L1-like esterase